MREVTLEEVLNAREERAALQNEMIRRHSCPLISFSMNIAGPVKNTPLIRRAFDEGIAMIEDALSSEGFEIECRQIKDEITGCEAVYPVHTDAALLKKLCVNIEESCGLGRLFDVDVIGTDGVRIARDTERGCIICGASGRGCASRRLHSVSELQDKTREIILDYFALKESVIVSEMVTAALIEEVMTTPKPGLVDRNNNGSHSDMNIETFLRSAEALRPYWTECFMTGAGSAGMAPGETFARLRESGIRAEADMLRATGGVNAHKGAIFLLGTVCGAIGRLYDPCCPGMEPESIARECAAMTRDTMADELGRILNEDELAAGSTAGEKIWRRYNLRGARGEIAEGLPGVIETGLTVFEGLLADGFSRNDAGSGTLVALIARGTDTNMVRRGGYDMAAEEAARAAQMVSLDEHRNMEMIRQLDREYIELNLSPGGCADLLAITYFLHDISRMP